MAVGGNVAHGCNIGHRFGIPLLSLGSMLATAAMVVGVAIAARVILRDHPALAAAVVFVEDAD